MSNLGTESPGDVAMRSTHRAVHDLLRAVHGPGAITERPLTPGYRLGIPGPTSYPQGIEAAQMLERMARRIRNEYASKARGEGASWADLAEPLGVGSDDSYGMSPAEAAFELVAGEPLQRFDRRWVSWRCSTCQSRVRDYGPYNGNPADDEDGHADSCERHQRELDEHLSRFE